MPYDHLAKDVLNYVSCDFQSLSLYESFKATSLWHASVAQSFFQDSQLRNNIQVHSTLIKINLLDVQYIP